MMYDAIVVGARVAGSPTAMLLARKGYKVLLVERATFPSDMMSGHYIHQPGMASLKRWGLLERLEATDTPPIHQMTFDAGPFALVGTPPAAEGVRTTYAPRRTLLDNLLVEAAVEAGAELREGFAVDGLVWDGDRVAGISGRSHGGPAVTETARIVIGADGPRSFIARSVRAPMYNVRPPLTATYYSYWSGVPTNGVEGYPRDGRFIVAAPTNAGLTWVGALWPVAEFPRVRADIEGNLLRTLEEHAPGLAERVHAGRREERFIGTGDQAFFFRKPYGPGWALVGDAGYHRDAVTAQGITDAFRDAELVANAVDFGLSGWQPLDQALAEFERRRNRAVEAMYEHTYQLAQLAPPPPQMQELIGALRGNQPEIDRFLGTIAGTTPLAEFFAPENVERIVGAASLAAVA